MTWHDDFPDVRLSNGIALPPRVIGQTIELHGERAYAWLAGLPALIDQLSLRWSLRALQPFENLSFNVVLQAVHDGKPVVLKVAMPNRELVSEIAALDLVGGDGAVALLAARPELGAMLLERVVPGTPLRQQPDDLDAASIAASAMRRFWRPPPPTHPFPDVGDWARGMARLRARYEGGTGPFPTRIVAQAEALFAELLATQRQRMVLHGDFHHGNILRDGRDGWKAIDPKGITGEPEYEVAAFLRNVDRSGSADPIGALRERIDLFARQLNLDPDRIRDWAVAESVLSAWWVVEDGGDATDAIANAVQTAELRA